MKKRPEAWIESVAGRLEKTRVALGFKSQKEFAVVLGVEYHAYNKWATRVSLPDAMVMVRLKEKFGVTTDWIYAGDHSTLPHHLVQKILTQTSSSLPPPPPEPLDRKEKAVLRLFRDMTEKQKADAYKELSDLAQQVASLPKDDEAKVG